ncbi:hypothetical protein MIND_01232800 [Mycena indigotica]|uniref:Uncharacterized protein n=1 Tax=Mycena indigotica TaxID=2126181 RepID=A0A8H6VS77_9AGAR|nr:uncharacterized protein MIND_01232800 [Mycena indigotica]KAF7292067.1 hypothetical protein MIND_01232800 [Mycena indigotica]
MLSKLQCQPDGPCFWWVDAKDAQAEKKLANHQSRMGHSSSLAFDSSLDAALRAHQEKKRRKRELGLATTVAIGDAEILVAQSSTASGPYAATSDSLATFDDNTAVMSEPDDTDMAHPQTHLEPESDPPLPPPSPLRPVRNRRPTWKILAQLPEPPPPPPDRDDELEEPDQLVPFQWEARNTSRNGFGLFREYPCTPSHNPDGNTSLADQSDVPTASVESFPATGDSRLSPLAAPADALAAVGQSASYGPFGNFTVWGLMNWMWTGSAMKSIGECARLLDYLKSPLFNVADLMSFDIKAQTKRFDNYLRGEGIDSGGTESEVKDGWQSASVEIDVPDPRKGMKGPLKYTIEGLRLRSLTETVKTVLSDFSRFFHYTPFRQWWQPVTDGLTQRVYDEIYSSDAYIRTYKELQRSPREPGCTLERCIVALMFWSDSTQLANFGTAALWPIYLFFGNQSKWVRGKPRARACHHIAYMPKLADDFFDWFKTTTGEAPTLEMLTHCRRELFHTIWRLILDDKFMEACEHGIEILCPDNIWRRFYFRVFTYSADYPEKVLLATICSLSRCPCPRCLLTADQFNQLGTVNDNKRQAKLHRVDDHRHRGLVRRARAKVYDKNLAPYGAAVKRILGPESYVPVMNAFSNVSTFTWDIFQMLAPDLMHELELGLPTLVTLSLASTGAIDRCQPLVETQFGRFTNNTSAMKRLAARDYEDLLQCAMPVFEGLLDDDVYGDNDVIQDLLFSMAYFHALAKPTWAINSARFAKSTCKHFVTKELPREEAARRKKAARKAPTSTVDSSPQFKAFNLTTVKMHLIGYYPLEIPFFGTTDSYSTAPGELEHKRGKGFYSRTSKNGAVTQISNLERREAELLRIQTKVQAAAAAPPIATLDTSSKRKRGTAKARAKSTGTTLSFADSESLPYTPPDFPHHISQSRNFYFTLDNWLDENTGDPAIKNFRRP